MKRSRNCYRVAICLYKSVLSLLISKIQENVKQLERGAKWPNIKEQREFEKLLIGNKVTELIHLRTLYV